METKNKIHFLEDSYNAVKEILTTKKISNENFELLYNNSVVYREKEHAAFITIYDLTGDDISFVIDVYYIYEDEKGEWIFNLVNYKNIDDLPKTYNDFIDVLDNAFRNLDEEFLSEYLN